jgi:hypothetical protein
VHSQNNDIPASACRQNARHSRDSYILESLPETAVILLVDAHIHRHLLLAKKNTGRYTGSHASNKIAAHHIANKTCDVAKRAPHTVKREV